MNSFMVSVSFFFLSCATALALYRFVGGSRRLLDQRLAELAIRIRVARGLDDPGDEEPDSFTQILVKWAAQKLPAADPHTPQGEKLARNIVQAGLAKRLTPELFQVVRVGLALGGALFAALVTLWLGKGSVVVGGLGGALLGTALPTAYLARRARARQKAIGRELSEVLDLIVVCVEAGLGLHEAIRLIGSEAERQKQAIGRELALVAAEISAGATLGQALRALAQRTSVEDIKLLAATITQSEQLGAQIGPALRSSSDALRAKRRLRAEEAAQKASIKILFPLVFFVLPSMIAIIVGPAMIQISRTLGSIHG